MVTAACLPFAARAQTASQITPPSFAPPREARPEAPLALPEETLRTPPAGGDRLFVSVAELRIDGGALSPATVAMLRARLVGRRVSVADIFAATGDAEAMEARTGHILRRVTVPQQDLTDGGTVRLAVVDGFIERVDVSGMPRSVRERIARLSTQLMRDHAITQAELERRLMLAADVPGVTVRSTLAPGDKPGGTVLRLDGDWHPVNAFLSLDNSLPEALGRLTFGAGIDLNSVLGLGEQIYLRASGLPNIGHRTSMLDPTPRDRALAAGVVLPLGNDGLTLTIEGTDARTAPRPANAVSPGFGSRFRRLSSTLRYPLVRRRSLTIGLSAGLDVENERVSIIDPVVLPLSQDRLRVVCGGADASAFLPGGGVVTAKIEASFGIDGLGARSAADATTDLPLSRLGTDADFRKLTLALSIDQPIARHLTIDARARAQTGFGEVMANAEQIGIASLDGISPLTAGSLQGDSGYVVRGEATVPFATAQSGILAILAPYAFAAQGGVRYEQPSIIERRTTSAFAYGAGLRITGQAKGGTPGISAAIEYGRAHLEGLRPDRLTFTILTRF